MINKHATLLKVLILFIILNSCNQHNKKLELSKNAMSEIADIRFVSTEVVEKGTSVISNNIFNKTIHLEGTNIEMNDVLFRPEVISLNTNRIVIVDEGDSNYFKIYSYPEFNLIGSYGRKGLGPDEINFPPIFSCMDNKKLEYFDFQKTSIFSISLLEPKTKIKLEYVLPPDLIEAQNATILNSNNIFGSGSNYGKLYFLDTTSDEIRYSSFLAVTNTLPKNHQIIFNDGVVAITTNKSFVIYAAKYFNYFEIYKSDGTKKYTYMKAILADQVFMQNGQITNNNTLIYYSSAYATNKHFYLLYQGGKSYNELLKNIETNNFTCEIHQYDLEGNPKNCFIVSVPIKSFCIDEKNGKIIIINPLSEESPIMQFYSESIQLK